MIAALSTFILSSQVLSRTASNGMGKTSIHFANNDQKEIGKLADRSVIYVPGTGHSLIEGRKGAYELAKDLFQEPVTLFHIGSDAGEKGPIGTIKDYWRTGLNMLDLWLGGKSPLGSGRAPLIEALNKHLEALPENHQASLVGFSAGGLPFAYLSPEAAKRVKDITFMGVPISNGSLRSLQKRHPNISVANLVD